MTSDEQREFWMLMRQALLLMVDAVERLVGIEPRTSELRKDKRNRE